MCKIHKNIWKCGYLDLRQSHTYERCPAWESETRRRYNKWILCPTPAGEQTIQHRMDRSCGHCATCAAKQRRRNEKREQMLKERDLISCAATFVEWEGSMGYAAPGQIRAAAEALVGCVEGGASGAEMGEGIRGEEWVWEAVERAGRWLGPGGVRANGAGFGMRPGVGVPEDRRKVRELWGQGIVGEGSMSSSCGGSQYGPRR